MEITDNTRVTETRSPRTTNQYRIEVKDNIFLNVIIVIFLVNLGLYGVLIYGGYYKYWYCFGFLKKDQDVEIQIWTGLLDITLYETNNGSYFGNDTSLSFEDFKN